MLTVKRKKGEAVAIFKTEKDGSRQRVATVVLKQIKGTSGARIGIDAGAEYLILREELLEDERKRG